MQVWGIATSAGMEAQVRALAQALDASLEIKRMALHPWLAWLPNECLVPFARFLVPYGLSQASDDPEAPWPDMVVSCGRRAAQAAMVLRPFIRRRGGKTRFVHIQDPHVSPEHFDLVIAMEHDAIRGDNVLVVHHALHAITRAALEEAASIFLPNFSAYPGSRIAVLLGGTTNKYVLSEEATRAVIRSLKQVLETHDASLLITPSRRTGERNIALLKEAFAGNRRVYLYDGEGVNPYMGLLALAEAIIVTDDSVNMMSEAAATGKPIYILKLPGHEDTKPSRFAMRLVHGGIARVLEGRLETWRYPENNEMHSLAQEVRRRFSR